MPTTNSSSPSSATSSKSNAPEPPVDREPENRYVFEKNVVFDNGDGTTSTRRIDLYRRGSF